MRPFIQFPSPTPSSRQRRECTSETPPDKDPRTASRKTSRAHVVPSTAKFQRCKVAPSQSLSTTSSCSNVKYARRSWTFSGRPASSRSAHTSFIIICASAWANRRPPCLKFMQLPSPGKGLDAKPLGTSSSSLPRLSNVACSSNAFNCSSSILSPSCPCASPHKLSKINRACEAQGGCSAGLHAEL